MQNFIKKLIYFLFLITFFGIFSFPQDKLKTNEEIIHDLTLSALKSFIKNIDISDYDTLNIKLDSDVNKQFISDFIIEYLSNEKKFNIKILDEYKANINYFEYLPKKIELNYSRPFREKFLGEKKILRNIIVEFNFKFIKYNELVNFTPVNLAYTDTIKYENINFIENKMLPLTITKLEEDSILDKYTIPIITVTTISIMVYLFFTIRK